MPDKNDDSTLSRYEINNNERIALLEKLKSSISKMDDNVIGDTGHYVISTALKALSDIDKQLLNLEKISTAKKANENHEALIAAIFEKAMSNSGGIGSSFRVASKLDDIPSGDSSGPKRASSIPTRKDSSIDSYDFIDGELDDSRPKTTFNQFVKDYEEKNNIVVKN